MNRINVNSSSIRSIGYDNENKTLEIEFIDGEVYQYLGVSDAIYQGLIAAPSLGRYLNMKIKNVYSFKRVT